MRRVEVCLAGWVGVTTAESVPLPRPSKSFSGTGHSPSGTKRFGSILGSPSPFRVISPQTPVLPSPPGKAENQPCRQEKEEEEREVVELAAAELPREEAEQLPMGAAAAAAGAAGAAPSPGGSRARRAGSGRQRRRPRR